MLDVKKYWLLHITGVIGCKGWIQTQSQLSIGSKKRVHTWVFGVPSTSIPLACASGVNILHLSSHLQNEYKKKQRLKVNDILVTVEAAIKIQMKTTQHPPLRCHWFSTHGNANNNNKMKNKKETWFETWAIMLVFNPKDVSIYICFLGFLGIILGKHIWE